VANYALVVAGGKGTRMQSDLPKQFMLLLDVPILMHTMERFVQAMSDIQVVLVLPKDQIEFWRRLCAQMDFDLPHNVVEGGASRYESVQNGLEACGDEGIVAIHDGVRPLVSHSLIESGFAAAQQFGSALPVVPITQSLRRRIGEKSEVVSREGMLAVQTPQCFDLAKLKPCYLGAPNSTFTDDATVFESHGHHIHLIEGEETNIKVTTPEDLRMAEAILGVHQTKKR
jgi:2-C-methyl-D-erythritol 4-phosphate cytidylyltransferase